MEILNAYDLTGSYRAAAGLCGCSHHTTGCVPQLMGQLPGAPPLVVIVVVSDWVTVGVVVVDGRDGQQREGRRQHPDVRYHLDTVETVVQTVVQTAVQTVADRPSQGPSRLSLTLVLLATLSGRILTVGREGPRKSRCPDPGSQDCPVGLPSVGCCRCRWS